MSLKSQRSLNTLSKVLILTMIAGKAGKKSISSTSRRFRSSHLADLVTLGKLDRLKSFYILDKYQTFSQLFVLTVSLPQHTPSQRCFAQIKLLFSSQQKSSIYSKKMLWRWACFMLSKPVK